MPLLPRESKLAFDQEGVIQWRSLLGGAVGPGGSGEGGSGGAVSGEEVG